jgi:hypothetical protein
VEDNSELVVDERARCCSFGSVDHQLDQLVGEFHAVAEWFDRRRHGRRRISRACY